MTTNFNTLQLPFTPPSPSNSAEAQAIVNESASINYIKAQKGTLSWEDMIALAAMAVCAASDPSEKVRLLAALRDLTDAAADSLEQQLVEFDLAFGDKG